MLVYQRVSSIYQRVGGPSHDSRRETALNALVTSSLAAPAMAPGEPAIQIEHLCCCQRQGHLVEGHLSGPQWR